MNQEKIGKFISTMRKKNDLTQEQLAEKLNVSKNAVSKWERGLNLPDVSLMQELCNILNITLNELFEGQKLTDKEIIENSKKNIMNIFITREKLETFKIFTDILIMIGIIITITLRIILAKSFIEELIVTLCGIFVWGYGLFLRIKINRILNNLNK